MPHDDAQDPTTAEPLAGDADTAPDTAEASDDDLDLDLDAPRRRSRKPLIFVATLIVAIAAFYSVHYAIANDATGDDTEQAADEEKDEKKGEGEEEDEKTPIPVRVTTIAPGEISAYISATANLVAENEVRLLAEWEGQIDRLAVEEGDYVKQDQVLATLARTDGEIAVQKAQVRADDAQLRFARAERLVAQELLASEDFDRVAVEKAIADQELAEARWNLEKTMIRAPFSGRLTQRMVQIGQHVRRGDELFTVTDFEPLVARIYLPESDVMALEVGREVRLAPKADESQAVRARIQRIASVVDTATGTVKVTVEAIDPPPALRPGAFVRVDIVRETHSDALLVPKQAVVRELQKSYVFVTSGDAATTTAEKRAIELGFEEGGRVEALSGLAAGDRVVIAGQGGLKDGAAVAVLADDDGDVASSRVVEVAR